MEQTVEQIFAGTRAISSTSEYKSGTRLYNAALRFPCTLSADDYERVSQHFLDQMKQQGFEMSSMLAEDDKKYNIITHPDNEDAMTGIKVGITVPEGEDQANYAEKVNDALSRVIGGTMIHYGDYGVGEKENDRNVLESIAAFQAINTEACQLISSVDPTDLGQLASATPEHTPAREPSVSGRSTIT